MVGITTSSGTKGPTNDDRVKDVVPPNVRLRVQKPDQRFLFSYKENLDDLGV